LSNSKNDHRTHSIEPAGGPGARSLGGFAVRGKPIHLPEQREDHARLMFDVIASNIKTSGDEMRTTLDIADDVLFAAKEIAQREKKSLGQVISDLARKAFAVGAYEPQTVQTVPQVSERLAQYGIQPLPSRGVVISNELIERLRDAEGV
jgi:hypothetical protein